MLKRRKAIITTAMAVGALVGAAGLAGAATTATQSATPDAQEQEPQLNGSVQATDAQGLSEAEESAGLASLATLSEDDARAAAKAAVPGKVGEVELENENGSVVWSVEITDASGAEVEVKVDAGDGSILDQQADDESENGDEAGESADESDHGNEAGESGESGESSEVSPQA